MSRLWSCFEVFSDSFTTTLKIKALVVHQVHVVLLNSSAVYCHLLGETKLTLGGI